MAKRSTPRQREVTEYRKQGLTEEAIAKKMGIMVRTIRMIMAYKPTGRKRGRPRKLTV